MVEATRKPRSPGVSEFMRPADSTANISRSISAPQSTNGLESASRCSAGSPVHSPSHAVHSRGGCDCRSSLAIRRLIDRVRRDFQGVP